MTGRYGHPGGPGPERRSDYAAAPDPSMSPNPMRLQRNRRRGLIAGVCAGLADYFSIDVVFVRIAAIAALFFAAPVTLFLYIAAAFIMPAKSEIEAPLGAEDREFWAAVSRRPQATLSNMKYRFQDMDRRLQDIERLVTSNEWSLRRQFRDIE